MAPPDPAAAAKLKPPFVEAVATSGLLPVLPNIPGPVLVPVPPEPKLGAALEPNIDAAFVVVVLANGFWPTEPVPTPLPKAGAVTEVVVGATVAAGVDPNRGVVDWPLKPPKPPAAGTQNQQLRYPCQEPKL